MIVVNDYRGRRVDVVAVPAGTRFNAEVRIRRVLSDEKPHVETVDVPEGQRHARRAGG